jgi:hypothetical protein
MRRQIDLAGSDLVSGSAAHLDAHPLATLVVA